MAFGSRCRSGRPGGGWFARPGDAGQFPGASWVLARASSAVRSATCCSNWVVGRLQLLLQALALSDISQRPENSDRFPLGIAQVGGSDGGNHRVCLEAVQRHVPVAG